MRVVKPWHRLPREAGDAPSLETSKARLDGALSSPIQWKMSLLMAGGWTGWPGEVPPSPNHPVILQNGGPGRCSGEPSWPGRRGDTCTHVCAHMYMHTCLYVYTHMHTQVHIPACTCTSMHACTRKCQHGRVHPLRADLPLSWLFPFGSPCARPWADPGGVGVRRPWVPVTSLRCADHRALQGGLQAEGSPERSPRGPGTAAVTPRRCRPPGQDPGAGAEAGGGYRGGFVAIAWGVPAFQKPLAPCSNPLTLLQETEMRHSKVVTLYRSHLLYAVQVRWGCGCGGTGETGMEDWGTSQPHTCARVHVGGSKGLDPGTANPGVLGPRAETP